MNCKRHPDRPAFAMWPWTLAEQLCEECVYKAQDDAETLSDRDRANWPVYNYYQVKGADVDGRTTWTVLEEVKK